MMPINVIEKSGFNTKLNRNHIPESATHIATCKGGVKHQYFVKFKDETIWILPSEQYGTSYAFCSIPKKLYTFENV